MIDRGHDLPITKQAEVLRISRGSIYYLPRPVPEADLAIMRHLDRLHLEFPFAGSRMLRGLDGHYLHRDGARLRLPRRGARLVQPPRPGVAAVDYDGGGVLHRDVYLRAYDSVSEARASIGRYFDFYNGRRHHASLDGNTPDQAYFNPLPIRMPANPGRDST